MQKLKYAFLGVATFAMSMSASAELIPGTQALLLSAGHVNFDNDHNVKDKPIYGVGYGYQVNDKWGFDVWLDSFKTRGKTNTTKTRGYHLHADAVRSYMPQDDWHLYWAGGLGVFNGDELTQGTHNASMSNNGATFHFAGGLKHDFSERSHFFGEVREVITKHNLSHDYDMVVRVGVRWALGGKKAEKMHVSHSSDASTQSTVLAQSQPEAMPSSLDVKFGFDSDIVGAEFFTQLEPLAKYLSMHSEAKVRLTGYTDDTGPEYYNKKLSARRAQSVANWLTEHYGIDEARIEVIGQGSEASVAMLDTDEEKMRHRRVESELLTDGVQEYA